MHLPALSKRDTFLLITFLVVLVFTIILVARLVIVSSKKSSVSSTPITTPILTPKPQPSPSKPKTTYSILIMGYGGEGHEGGTLSDSIMLAYVDTVIKKVFLISIPRDTWINIPENGNPTAKKINNAFSIGGGALAKQMVAQVTGVTPDNFIAIDFTRFTKAIDALGGVDVNVPASFDDNFYPIKGLENEACGKSAEDINAITATMSGYLLEQQFPCRYEHLHFVKGVMHMDGTTALKFVRSRHADVNGGDFSRSQRQQALLQAVEQKAISLGALTNSIAFFRQFAQMVNTDIDESIVQPTLTFLGDPKGYSIKTINLSTDNVFTATTSSDRQYILVPKTGNDAWDSIHEFIQANVK